MKMRTTTIAVIVGGLFLLNNVGKSISEADKAKSAAKSQADYEEQFTSYLDQEKRRTQELHEFSAIALGRLSTCQFVAVNDPTGQYEGLEKGDNAHFFDGLPIVFQETGVTIPDGTTVCNDFGETAVTQDGKVDGSTIRRIGANHIQEARQIMTLKGRTLQQ